MTDLAAPEFSMDAIAAADKAAQNDSQNPANPLMGNGTATTGVSAPAPADAVPKQTILSAPEFSPQAIAEADRSWQAEDTMALRSNLMQASQQNPDQTAKALPIAKSMDLPVPTVANNLPMLTRQQQFTHEYVDNLQKMAPKTADWLKNPTNAALAHDDIDSLTQLEGMSQASLMLDTTALSLNNNYQGIKAQLGNQLASVPGLENYGAEMRDSALFNLRTAADMAKNNVIYSDNLETYTNRPDFTSSPVAGFLYDTTQGLMNLAPAFAAGAINPLAGAAAFGATFGGEENATLLGRGASFTKAGLGGIGAGAIATIAGPLLSGPSEALVKAAPGLRALPDYMINFISKSLIPMEAMGIGTEALDTGIDHTLEKPTKTWAEFASNLPEMILQNAATAGAFHAGHAAIGASHDAVMSRFSAQYAAAKAAAETAPILQKFNDVSANSPLRSRSPDSFNSFLQSATEDTPIHTLYVEPAAMEKAGVTSDQLAQALPHLADDIADATNNGFAVKIPAADFGAALAGTPLGDSLLPHLKTDPNGMSLAESEDFVKSGAAQQFETEMTKAAATHTDAAEFDASAKRVEDQIKSNYAATGRFPNDVNASTARLGAFYKVLAHSYGITPEEAYARYGATITGADMVPGAETFDGTVPPPAAKPEKVVAAPPEPAAKISKPVLSPEIDSGLKSLRTKAESSKNTTKPLLKYLKKAGINPESTDASELRKMGITNKTMPGLFKRKIFDKQTGIERDVAQGLDNIPHDELRAALGDAGPNRADLNGYVDRQWLLDKIEAEHKLGANADTETQASPEDENAASISAEIQHYGLDLKKMDDATIKRRILAGRAKDAMMESKAMGQELTPAGAREVANLMGQGYDIQEAIDSVAERDGFEALKSFESALGYDHIAEIPFPDFPAPADAGAKGEGDSGFPGDDGQSRPTDQGADSANPETNAGQTDSALLDEAQRLKESDLFDEQGRAIDKAQDDEEFHQTGSDKANASYNPTTQEIWLGKNANLSSMLHEEGHHFLNVYTKLAAEPNAPQRIKDIADAALEGLDVKGATPEERLKTWQDMSVREQATHHEPWARGFERFLFRGKAPNIALQPAFDAFRGWLKHTYGSIKDFVRMHPEAGSLNEELRGVMDRMLATDAEIEYARQVRNFEPLFKSAEEGGMTPDEYKSYQNLGAQSFQDAAAELQGRSLRDMTLTRKMHEKTVKALNKDALEKRKAVQDEVTQSVLNEPVNRARDFLKTGTIDGVQRRGVHRLDIDDVKRMYGDEAAGLMDKLEGKFGKYGILAKGGLHPDEVAPAFGFETGRDMIQAMVDQPNVKDRIAALTDQTVLERYGDLKDAQAIARRADQAVHNDARIRSVATELNAVRKAIGKTKIMNEAAKQYAAQMIARQKVGEIDPSRYANAAAKAAKTALEAMGKGKLDEVAEAKRNQLVNEHATKLAYEALDRIEKIRNNARRYDKAAVRKSIGTDIEQIDAILDQYDMRRSAVARTTSRTQSLLDWYNSQIEAGYEPMIDEEIINKAANPDQKTHFTELTMDQLRGVDVAVRTVERTAKNRKEILRDGQKVALNTVVGELVDRMQERPEKFSAEDILNKPRAGIDPIGKVFLDRLQSKLRAGIVSLTPQDFRANKYDLHEIGGPFHRYIFDKFFDRNYWKQDTLTGISKAFEAKVKELGDGWQKSLYDLVPNKMLIDKAASTGLREDPITGKSTYDNPVYRRLTRGDLIGIARHVGNESNFMKLAKGMGWDPADIWRFLDTNMRASDWKAVRAEWDAFDRFWPESEAMVRRLGGIVPEKIPLRPFETQFGMMRGGYAPIDYDPIRSELSKRLTDGKLDPTESIGQKDVYKATTTMNSSLRNRIEGYSDIVNLDYHYMTRRLHETIHDLAYREAILDAKKIMGHEDFRASFEQTFGPEEYQALQQFVTNVQEMYKRDQAMDNFEKVIQYTRAGVVMTGVGYRVTTVLKHGSSAGLKSLGFLEGNGKKYLMARVNRMATGNLNADIADARAKFPEINARLARMDRDFSAGEHSLYDPDTLREKNNRMGHAMVAWSDALTAIPTAHAAYDWAITEGVPKKFGGSGKPMTHEEAVRFANGVVRQAHGSAIEAARSNFLHEKGMASLLGMIYQFQNNTFGQYADIIDKYKSEASRYTSNPALAGRIMATLIAPAVVTWLVSHKGLTDDPWFEQLGMAVADEIASTVPVVRDGWSMAVAMLEGRQADGAELPPIRVAGDILKTFKDAWQELHGKQSHILQDAGNAIGETFHVAGLGQAGKTAQYIRDVHNNKQNPKSIPAAVVGAAIGGPPKHQGHPSKPGSIGDFFGGGALSDH